MLERFRLDGKVAVITGGGGGLGSLAARTFAGAGADVVLLGRNAGKLDAAAAEVRQAGCSATVIHADVTSGADLEKAAQRVAADFGGADILFNNAGITSPRLMLDTEPDEWQS
ncbi:MAG: SDR family NAD(P)-dependent oxidoreductase, partial [Alphaproteobacteria bacterium]|nr:SDR family NAD(P)-dependent oxidoreductase [Alphaproteobacteria bacterium]MDX5368865.1 SDR family NAD(P)-dependent oxidoreductase [Alphaproteobacteria bacterium]MDX5463589.1 SDR family NAD(P)-dependent oxidoreductase [Alphaproteobacteria bacterium]